MIKCIIIANAAGAASYWAHQANLRPGDWSYINGENFHDVQKLQGLPPDFPVYVVERTRIGDELDMHITGRGFKLQMAENIPRG